VLSIRRLEGSRWRGGRVWSLKRDLVLPGDSSNASGYAEKLLWLWQTSLDWARQWTKSALGRFASGKPSLAGLRLTFREVTIAARVERDGRVSAMGTVVNMTAQRRGAATPDSYHCQLLFKMGHGPCTSSARMLFYHAVHIHAPDLNAGVHFANWQQPGFYQMTDAALGATHIFRCVLDVY
jgi:hypothetical protein